MSDTPRMQSALLDAPDAGFANIWKVGCDIERELNAANAIIKQQQLLNEENLRLQDRIKLLEEMYEGKIGENEQCLGSNLQGLLTRELNAANERIQRLEATTNDPHALWANWLRGSVTLPVGIGDVRQYQDRIKRLEETLEGVTDKLDGAWGIYMEFKEPKP